MIRIFFVMALVASVSFYGGRVYEYNTFKNGIDAMIAQQIGVSK